MPEQVKAVIFDMDNTLFDLVGAKHEACRSVARYLKRDDWEDLFDYFVRPDYGFEDWRNIRDYLLDRNVFVPADYNRSCSIYETAKLDSIRPYPGIADILERLRSGDVPLALVTDADMTHARARLDVSGFSGQFRHVITYEMTGRKKPDHAPFLLALKKLEVKACETVMIGDSPVRDLAPAKAIGMHTIYARYGDRLAATRSEIAGHYCAGDPGDLETVLLSLIGMG